VESLGELRQVSAKYNKLTENVKHKFLPEIDNGVTDVVVLLIALHFFYFSSIKSPDEILKC